MKSLQIHPSCELIPEMDPETFDSLLADIRENGVKVPIWLYDGKIIDGRNRYRACRELDIECPTIETHGEPDKDVISLNVIRRHLDESQRSLIAARMPNVKRTDTLKHGSRSANLQNEAVTVAKAAKSMNVSPRNVESAKTVLKEGGPRLIAAVASGAMSVSKAAKAVGKSKKAPSPAKPKKRAAPKPDKMKGQALLLWSHIRWFSEEGMTDYKPEDLMKKMTDTMIADMFRLVPSLISWLKKFPETKGELK